MEQEMLEKILKLTEETNVTIKIVQKDVEELKERVTALEQRMDKLEQRMDKLEKEVAELKDDVNYRGS